MIKLTVGCVSTSTAFDIFASLFGGWRVVGICMWLADWYCVLVGVGCEGAGWENGMLVSDLLSSEAGLVSLLDLRDVRDWESQDLKALVDEEEGEEGVGVGSSQTRPAEMASMVVVMSVLFLAGCGRV